MATSSRCRAAALLPAKTPLAKRAIPVPKLIILICLRCSKRVSSSSKDCIT
jgi:hypothetical protein